MAELPIDVWSDVACPWCWVGKRHLESALEAFEGEVALRWRAFELDPGAPTPAPERVDYVERLATKYRTSRADAEAMIGRMVAVGRSRGLALRFDRIRPTNTFDAHRLLAWSARLDRQTDLEERLFSAYLHEGLAISDHHVLAGLAADVGLDRDAAEAVLGSDAHGEEVRADERLAAQLGISGVPFFVLGGRYAVSGAQPPEVLSSAMARALEDASSVALDEGVGEACTADGCEVGPTG